MIARSPRPGKSLRSNFRGSYGDFPAARFVLSLSTEVTNLFISSASLDALAVREMCISASALVSSSLGMLESARMALMGSASLKEILVAAAIASRFCDVLGLALWL